ncbi:methyltransferase domain-containing protein [Mycobacterium sp. pW049]|uniref:class I SAM-dependent methyltransferase n=1 Tax=[Mycobacterium] bulgaricum TaxID=3238985 RepID=UPI00351B3615
MASLPPSAAPFALYFDRDLSRPTPYDGSGNYLRMAKPRLDHTYRLIAPYVANAHIVDIGASPFYLLDRALEGGASRASAVYFAYDQHPLKDSERIYSCHGEIELSHFNIEDQDWPFGNDSVDVITACEILEHCEYFPLRFANEVRRVLRPGGVLLITVPNVASVANIAKLVLGKNIFMKYRADATGRHKHEYTMSQLCALVNFMGLETVGTGYMPFVTSHKTWPRAAYRTVARTPGLRRYSPKLYILARQRQQKLREPLTVPPAALYDSDMSIED